MVEVHQIGMTNAITLSNYILKHYGPMSHLKLQKLLFYCEAYHLAYFKQSVIPEDFEAWVHGPVCRTIFNNLRDTSILHSDIGFDSNEPNPDIDITKYLASSQIELLNSILKNLSDWTGIELETATHQEYPWIEARKGLPPSRSCSNIISKTTMQEYYYNEING